MSGDNVSSAGNQQETMYYYCGFMVGECSICLIKAKHKYGGSGFYFTPDFTVSNADSVLLKRINRAVADGRGVITPIKGGYNLSFRGKSKVPSVLAFFDRNPPICGDMIQEKLLYLRQAIDILLQKKNCNVRLPDEVTMIEALRQKLKELKKNGKAGSKFPKKIISRTMTGYFLSGIVDAEGSMGFRKCGKYYQPYFTVAMREEEIINLFQEFFGFGSKYYRPAQKLYQFETGRREYVSQLAECFLHNYPVMLSKNRKRLQKLQRILNDYTPRAVRK